MVKVSRIAAFTVESPLANGQIFTDLKEAEKAVRTAIIEEEVDCSHADAAQIAEQWDQIDAKVKEAMRGL
jgi:hypothetical protein